MTKTVVDAEVLDIEMVADALKTSPYGSCVYEAGNDVVDHQTVTLEYEGGVTATMIMSACELSTYSILRPDCFQSLKRSVRDRQGSQGLKGNSLATWTHLCVDNLDKG
jgi:hypothetical protein